MSTNRIVIRIEFFCLITNIGGNSLKWFISSDFQYVIIYLFVGKIFNNISICWQDFYEECLHGNIRKGLQYGLHAKIEKGYKIWAAVS